MGIAFMILSMVLYTVHVTCQVIDGGATEADGGASTPVGPSVATPLNRLSPKNPGSENLNKHLCPHHCNNVFCKFQCFQSQF